MEKASGKKVPYTVGPRRDGDLTESYCNPEKALQVLGWRAELDLDRMCEDAWRWQSNNPQGFE
jgi:UDP-glucose 4-epimerase